MLAVARLFAQEHPPMILEIYRDPVKPGSETPFKAIEQDAARRCVELRCPHPHLAIETLAPPIEVWWLNAFKLNRGRPGVLGA